MRLAMKTWMLLILVIILAIMLMHSRSASGV